LGGEGQCSASEFFGPGVCRFWRFHVVLPFRTRMGLRSAQLFRDSLADVSSLSSAKVSRFRG
jgi:hypothetical protein